MTKPWILDTDGDLMNRSRVSILPYFDKTEVQNIDLWSPNDLPNRKKRYILNMKGGKIAKLEKYGLYPNSGANPIVGDEMKDVILNICGADQVDFFETEIVSKYDERKKAWCVVPLNVVDCVDLTRSKVLRWCEENISAYSFDKVRFKDNCMNNLAILRVTDPNSMILVSDELKQAMENFNSFGTKFYSEEEYQDDF